MLRLLISHAVIPAISKCAHAVAGPPSTRKQKHTLVRHARTRSGHPPERHALAPGWIAGSSPAMTRESSECVIALARISRRTWVSGRSRREIGGHEAVF